MQRRWIALEEPGTEQLTLTPTVDGLLAEGRFAGAWNGQPATGGYRLHLRPDWRVEVALPIRRTGKSGEIRAVYIGPPDLLPRPAHQRYTRLGDGRWRYESLVSGYITEITVDEEGLVLEYPGLFTRTGEV